MRLPDYAPRPAQLKSLLDSALQLRSPKSRRSSFHTTICVLEGLLEYERAGRKSPVVIQARKRAENYLLERRLFRSLRTGEVINKRWLRFSFPTFWHYEFCADSIICGMQASNRTAASVRPSKS